MTQYSPTLAKSAMFRGVAESDINNMLGCLNARLRTYRKGEYIVHQGDNLSDILMVVSGSVHIQKEDYWGNRHLLGRVSVGEVFGEAYASPDSGVLLNDVVAAEDCAVIFFDVVRVLTTCSSACRFHAAVVQNLFFAVCDKNRSLVQKLGHMSGRTTRDKLLSYLSEQAAKNGARRFIIPFNRQQLADYLSVDRSAMSNELCKLRDDGLLTFRKNEFELL